MTLMNAEFPKHYLDGIWEYHGYVLAEDTKGDLLALIVYEDRIQDSDDKWKDIEWDNPANRPKEELVLAFICVPHEQQQKGHGTHILRWFEKRICARRSCRTDPDETEEAGCFWNKQKEWHQKEHGGHKFLVFHPPPPEKKQKVSSVLQ